MKLIFWGYNDLGEHVLKYFINNGYDIPMIISPSSDKVKNSRLKTLLNGGTRVISIRDTDHEVLEKEILAISPDIMIACSFRYKIPPNLIKIGGVNIINIHGAKLPHYRGGNMINWAIIKGLEETAITLINMEETIDTGDILAEKKIPIYYKDTAVTLKERMYTAIYELFDECLKDIIDKKIVPREQDHTKAYYLPARKPGDGLINWESNAIDIYNLVRALVCPYPGAFTYYRDKKVIIEKASLIIDNRYYMHPGRIIDLGHNYIIATTQYNLLKIEELRGHNINDLGIHIGGRLSSKRGD